MGSMSDVFARDAVSREENKAKQRILVRRYLRNFDLFRAGFTQSNPRRFAAKTFFHSVGYALEGLAFAFKQERNLRIDTYLVTGAIALGFLVGLNLPEWVSLIQMMGLILFAELANTVVEWLVDLLTNGRYDLRAKRIKDIAAGACLIVALCSYGVAFLLFWPHLLRVWG